jgi:DNA modification methylase
MIRLLQDIPKGQGPVIDPFLGSGTTMLACLETGHDGIGIEREREYIEIADARVRHANVANAAWDAAVIESDVEPQIAEVTEVGFGDLLGL